MQESHNICSDACAGDFNAIGYGAYATCINRAPVGSPCPWSQSWHDSVAANHDGQSQQQDDARLEALDLIEQQLLTLRFVARAGMCEELAHLLVAGLQAHEPIGHVTGFDSDIGVGKQSPEVPPRRLVIFSTRRIDYIAIVGAAEIVSDGHDYRPVVAAWALEAEPLWEEGGAGESTPRRENSGVLRGHDSSGLLLPMFYPVEEGHLRPHPTPSKNVAAVSQVEQHHLEVLATFPNPWVHTNVQWRSGKC